MRDTESQLAISCHQMKLPVPGLVYIQLTLWPKGSYRNPQTAHAVAKTMSYPPQTEPLPGTTPTTH